MSLLNALACVDGAASRRMRIEAYLDLVLRVGIGVSVLVAAWLAR